MGEIVSMRAFAAVWRQAVGGEPVVVVTVFVCRDTQGSAANAMAIHKSNKSWTAS